MKRTPLLRKTPLRAKATLKRGKPLVSRARLESRSTLARTTLLRKTPLKAKRRKPKPGDEPAYKAWVKTQPCVVGGARCGKVDPHHLIDGKGDAKKGMGQTAPDRFLLPLCRKHHDAFHDRRGFCRGWDDAQRLTFQEQECERLRAVWADLLLLGVLQEPAARCL